MRCLIIDTASSYLCVVLSQGEQVIARYSRFKERAHGKLLVSAIQTVLKQGGVTLDELDCLAVDTGPGSFTGLRIGVATAKGLGLALRKPLIGFSGLDALAARVPVERGLICSMIDAKRQQVYAALYSASAGGVRRKGKYMLSPASLFMKNISGHVVVTGDAVALYREQIQESARGSVAFTAERFWRPDPASLAKLCFSLWRKKRIVNAEKMTAQYLYSNTCTVRNKGKSKKVKVKSEK